MTLLLHEPLIAASAIKGWLLLNDFVAVQFPTVCRFEVVRVADLIRFRAARIVQVADRELYRKGQIDALSRYCAVDDRSSRICRLRRMW